MEHMKKKEFEPSMELVGFEWNWKFWKPVKCIGGKVFLGPYAKLKKIDTGEESLQTMTQFEIKWDMGLIKHIC